MRAACRWPKISKRHLEDLVLPGPFLSHNGRDKPEVETLARALLDRGVRPWLDKWDLTPGRPWQTEIEQALAASRAIVVCIGAHGIGSVQTPELQVALNRVWRDPNRLVIPVVLPSAPANAVIPDLLATRTWIDLRTGDYDEGVDCLVAALDGRSPGPRKVERLVCPYRGLRVFDELDAPLFFGRESALASCLARIGGEPRLLTLVGASGTGKSSLLLAGILPAVRTGEVDGHYDWQVVRLRPGSRPLHQLAVRLTALTSTSAREVEPLCDSLWKSTATLSDQIDLIFAASPEVRILVAVDQLEEVFTQTESEKERRAFLENLVYAAAVPDGRVQVVATLRADFFGHALRMSRSVAAAIAESQETLLPMSRQELHEAIVRPAGSLRFDDGLVDTLVNEVADQPGNLPLLQFVLEALWEKRNGNHITWRSYEGVGQLRGAITKHAEAAFLQLSADGCETLVRLLVRRLVCPGEGEQDTRRRARPDELSDLAPGMDGVVDDLVAARLLTAGEEGVELAHEALLYEWPRLRAWILEDREALRVQHDVTAATSLWSQASRMQEDLWRGARLARALELDREGRLSVDGTEVEFLQASRGHEEHLRARREQEERRRQELETVRERMVAQRRSLSAALLALTLVLVLAVVAVALERRASIAENRANREAEAANRVADFLVGIFDASNPSEARGESTTAREILDRGASSIADGLEDQPEIRARLIATMGEVYGSLGLYAEAATLLKNALAIQRDALGDTHPDTLASIHRLGAVLSDWGPPEVAEDHLREAVRGRRQVLGEDHADTLESLDELGSVLVRLGDFDEAEVYVRRALEGRRQALGSDSPETLSSLNSLGVLLIGRGEFEAAKPYFVETLELSRRVLGDDHPQTLRSADNLGGLLLELGDLHGAKARFASVLDGRRKVLGDDHPNTLYSISNLAFVLAAFGDLQAAEAYYHEAVLGFQRVLGPEALATVDVMISYADLLISMEKHSVAESLLADAIRGAAAVAPGSAYSARAIEQYGRLLIELKRYVEAERVLLEGAGLLGEDLDHSQKALILRRLVELYEAWGDEESAHRWQERLTPVQGS